jgi:hypothetical protein
VVERLFGYFGKALAWKTGAFDFILVCVALQGRGGRML